MAIQIAVYPVAALAGNDPNAREQDRQGILNAINNVVGQGWTIIGQSVVQGPVPVIVYTLQQ